MERPDFYGADDSRFRFDSDKLHQCIITCCVHYVRIATKRILKVSGQVHFMMNDMSKYIGK